MALTTGPANSPPAARGTFTYTALSEPKEIRLLHILSIFDDRITCTLEPVPLSANPKYFALSYCWETSLLDHSITMNGKSFKVTANLFAAIQAVYKYFELEESDHVRQLIWIDAIGINQRDDAEKSHQVQRMDQIFKSAVRVLVWLGPEAGDSAKVMKTLRWLDMAKREQSCSDRTLAADKLDFSAQKTTVTPTRRLLDVLTRDLERVWGIEESRLRALLRLLDDFWAIEGRGNEMNHKDMREFLGKAEYRKDLFPPHDAFWTAFIDLANRDWFFRVWTYQEIILAKAATVLCGDEYVDWGALNYTRPKLFALGRLGSLFVHKAAQMDPNAWCIKAGASGIYYLPLQSNRLRDLLWSIGSRQATDPRDYVYGLLAVVGDEVRSKIVVNYAQTPSAVFADAFRISCQGSDGVKFWSAMMERYSLRRRFETCQIEGLPSWCPNFASWNLMSIGWRGSRYIAADIVDFWMDFTNCMGFEEESHVMYVKSLRLDTIESITALAVNAETSLWAIPYMLWPQTNWSLFTASWDPEQHRWLREMVGLLSSDKSRKSRTQEQWLGHFPRVISLKGTQQQHTIFEELVSMFQELLSFYVLYENIQGKDIETLDEAVQRLNITIDYFEKIFDMWIELVIRQASRFFFLTTSGMPGYAPERVQPGDEICFIPGGRVLHVFSPVLPSGNRKYVTSATCAGFVENGVKVHDEWRLRMETLRVE